MSAKKTEIVPKTKSQLPAVKDGGSSIAAGNPESLIAMAIKEKLPVENLERLMKLRAEYRAEIAKEEFDNAMAEFQGECPIIKKTKEGGKTNAGEVAYYYAPLESIVDQVRELLKRHGFSYSMKTETLEGSVSVTCCVKHICGHMETSSVQVPLGTQTKVMSNTQVVAAALTFAKRLSFCNAFGILTGDDDMDGRKMAGEPEDQQQGPANKPESGFQSQTKRSHFTQLSADQIQKNRELFSAVCRVVPFNSKIKAEMEAATREYMLHDYSELMRKQMNNYYNYQKETRKVFNDQNFLDQIFKELKVSEFEFLDTTNSIIALEAMNEQFLKKTSAATDKNAPPEVKF